MLVIAAYGLGWWARGALDRERDRKQQAAEEHADTPDSAVRLLEAVHREVARAGLTGDVGKLEDLELELRQGLGIESLDGPVHQSVRAVRLTLNALRRPGDEERARRVELAAAEHAARAAADLAAEVSASHSPAAT